MSKPTDKPRPFERAPHLEPPLRLPRLAASGLVEVDPGWGVIQQFVLASGLETIGELEVIAAIEAGEPLVDTRLAEYVAAGTLPTARAIGWEDAAALSGEFDPARPTIVFCNGPQCQATPRAVEALLGAGLVATALRYYRGGIHDWVTLGLPLAPLEIAPSQSGTISADCGRSPNAFSSSVAVGDDRGPDRPAR